MSIKPRTIAPDGVEQEQLGRERVRGDMRFAEKMDALFQQGAQVGGWCGQIGHAIQAGFEIRNSKLTKDTGKSAGARVKLKGVTLRRVRL